MKQKNNLSKSPVESLRTRFKAPIVAYSERFVLSPTQTYDASIEGCKLFMHNTTNSFKRITFWIEDIKEKK